MVTEGSLEPEMDQGVNFRTIQQGHLKKTRIKSGLSKKSKTRNTT